MSLPRPSHDLPIVVVGAGFGGLASAIVLGAAGLPVRILDRAASAGGKASTSVLGGREMDAGPTVLTMPWAFDQLFDLAGASFRTDVKLARDAVIARHVWSDGTWLDLHADRAASADAIGLEFGVRERRAYLEFCEQGRQMYALSEAAFLRSQRPTMGSIVKQFGAAGLAAFARLDGHRSMWRALEQRFRSPRLQQLFGRYATYCGSSPFEAPATLNLIAHVEAEGLYRVEGGMRALSRALEKLARSLGVQITFERSVDEILVERGRVAAVVSNGERIAAGAVVWNGDVSALAAAVAGPGERRVAASTPPGARSFSAVTCAMLARPSGLPLVHHNVFFSDDYAAEFRALVEERRVPAAPTVYVCAQDRGDDRATMDGDERFLVLVNAPATGDRPDEWKEAETERCTNAMRGLLGTAGLTLAPSATATTTPADFHRRFPGTGGALYGPRSKGALSVLSRQGATSKIPGLYLAGGSVHPGPGVPMATLSGRLAAECILRDLPSTARSRPAATTGTTSTP